ncbi:MAG TPA: glycosyltransferase family A protein, partial [Solirubrobacteraceae bacterium]
MRVVAVVLSVDEAALLETSLPPAVAQADEVLVVDDACTDATAAVARRLGAHVVRLERRVSYASAMNAGLAATRGADAVLLLNADCVLEDGFVAAASAALEGDRVGSVAPLLLRATAGDEVDAAGMTI